MPQTERSSALIAIKTLHTLAWLFFVGCIFVLPVAAAQNRFGLAAALSAIVLVECLALAFNRGRCPLTNVAEKFTRDRMPNFDIYLPVWMARYNKIVFGALFVAGGCYALLRWVNGVR